MLTPNYESTTTSWIEFPKLSNSKKVYDVFWCLWDREKNPGFYSELVKHRHCLRGAMEKSYYACIKPKLLILSDFARESLSHSAFPLNMFLLRDTQLAILYCILFFPHYPKVYQHFMQTSFSISLYYIFIVLKVSSIRLIQLLLIINLLKRRFLQHPQRQKWMWENFNIQKVKAI